MTMYSIELTNIAKRQLDKLEYADQQRIRATLDRILARPRDYVKHLSEINAYSLFRSDYRIILDIIEQKLVVLVIKSWYPRSMYSF